MDSYADELGQILLSIVDYAQREDQPAVLELAVATAERALLEVPGGYCSPPLQRVARIACGRRLAEARLADQAGGGEVRRLPHRVPW